MLYIQQSRAVFSHYECLDIFCNKENQLTSVSADLPITVPCRDIYHLHQHTDFTQNLPQMIQSVHRHCCFVVTHPCYQVLG